MTKDEEKILMHMMRLDMFQDPEYTDEERLKMIRIIFKHHIKSKDE